MLWKFAYRGVLQSTRGILQAYCDASWIRFETLYTIQPQNESINFREKHIYVLEDEIS